VDALESHQKFHEEKSSPKVPKVRKTRVRKPGRERRTPAPEKKLKCSYCEMRVAYKNELDRHEKIHLNIRDFICEFCKKGFITKPHMFHHIKKHHGYQLKTPLTAVLECEHCGKKVSGQTRLEIHIKSQHHGVSISQDPPALVPTLPHGSQDNTTKTKRRKSGDSPLAAGRKAEVQLYLPPSTVTQSCTQPQSQAHPHQYTPNEYQQGPVPLLHGAQAQHQNPSQDYSYSFPVLLPTHGYPRTGCDENGIHLPLPEVPEFGNSMAMGVNFVNSYSSASYFGKNEAEAALFADFYKLN
jgi:hypothetical protein